MPNISDSKSAQVATQLRRKDDWKLLFDGTVDAIRLVGFATHAECARLLDFVKAHPRIVEYTSAAGIMRLGNSFSDVRKSGQIAAEYSKPDLLEEVLPTHEVVARILGTIAASWPYGLETYTYQSLPLHRSIARRLVGGGAEPHDDNVAKEILDDPTAAGVTLQLGVNLYIEVSDGGELQGWHKRLNRDEYEQLRNPDRKLSYGVRRDAIGDPDWVIKPELGDLIIFINSELHAICPSAGPRSTWGFFLGFKNDNKPLLIWS